MNDWRGVTARLDAHARRTLFFVGGAPRSGTTWLQQMLDAHPAVACRGEGLFLHHLVVPLEQVMAARREVLDGKNTRLFGHTGGFPLPDQLLCDHLLATAILLAFDQYGAGSDIRAMGEKTPENVFFFPRLAALFPDARFIAIARDPRDALSSAWHMFARGTGQDIDRFVRDALPSMAAGARAMLNFAEAYPERTRIVTYEALLRDTAGVLAGLFRLLGVGAEPAELDRIVAATSFTRATGGRPPGEARDGAFLRAGVAGAWRDTFTTAQAGQITDALGWMYPHFGWQPA